MPRNTLITFLGRIPKSESGYRTTRYDFGDGIEQHPVAFFGWPLAERVRPDRLVILGTAGSMWDHLFEGDLDLGTEEEEARLALVDAVEKLAVTYELLQSLEPLIERRLQIQVRLQLIPYSRVAEEQIELLRILANHIDESDVVDLDVTHAFRHLPMIALMGALYLRKVKGIDIGHIWYGAFDPDKQEALVHDLSGLLLIADWVTAVSTYDKDGDYGVFADLLPEELGSVLANASFLETVNNIGQARGKVRKALDQLCDLSPPDQATALFYPDLIERLQWARKDHLHQRQRTLADQHLKGGRYFEATIYGYEAFITSLAQQHGLKPDQVEHREQAREIFDAEEKRRTPRSPRHRAWDCLRRLRNALVHGTRPKGEEVQRAISDRSEMHKLLHNLFDELLSEDA